MFDPIDDQQQRDDEGIEKMLVDEIHAQTARPGYIVFQTIGPITEFDSKHCQRVSACVNACAGIDDDELRIIAAGANANVRLGLLAAAATMASSIRVPLTPPAGEPCEDCGTLTGVEHIPCPYASDIDGDDTLHWLCNHCAGERANDI